MMDDLVKMTEPEVSLQKLANYIDDGDRASLDGNFLQAASLYEAALSMLGEQVSFDFERTRDCLNKLINVHTQLENKDKLVPLIEQLTQIEGVRNVKMLQSSAEFFAQRNDTEKAVATYRKAFQLARNIRPLNAPLLSDLKESYAEQKGLLRLSDSSENSADNEALENALPVDDLLFDDELSAPSEEMDAVIPDASGAVQKNRVMRGVGLAVASGPKTNPLAILDFAKAPIFLLFVSAVFLVSAGKLFSSVAFNAGSQKDTGPENFSGLQYFSCDHAKSLKFTKDGLCIRADSSGNVQSKYWILSDQLNFPDLFRGYLRRKEYWYRSEGDELIDDNQVVLYQPQARERMILDKMWFYAKCAQDQFNENKRYPSSLEKSKRTYQNYSYINPFTGKVDCAELLVLGLQGKQIDLGSRGASDRQWRPGAILCLHPDTKHFSVQGFDREGKPLVSSDPRRYFVIDLEYGKCLTPDLAAAAERAKIGSASKQKLSPDVNDAPLNERESSVVLIDKDGSVENSITALRRLPQIVLWSALLAAIGALCLSKKFKNPKRTQVISKRSIVCCVIGLIVFYTIAFF